MWWIPAGDRRLPWWMYPRPCVHCRRRAWRWCLVCDRRCCRDCRSGSGWVWCCLDDSCRRQFPAAKLELRRLRLMERTLFCLVCHEGFTRQLVRTLEPVGPDDVLELRHVVIQHPRCACPPMTPQQRRALERYRRRHPGGDDDAPTVIGAPTLPRG